MGESKRKRREHASQVAERTTCSYAKGQVLHLVCLDDEEVMRLDAGLAADLVRAPNAMRPRGFSMAGEDMAGRLATAMLERTKQEGKGCGFDADGRFVRSFEGDPFDIEAFHEMRGLTSETAVMLSGERVSFTSSGAEGLMRADGTAVPDVQAAMSGLVRLDARGTPIVHADAPVSVQFAAIQTALLTLGDPATWTESDHADAMAIIDHGKQLGTVSLLGPVTPDAWIDRTLLMEAMAAHVEGIPADADDMVDELVGDLDSARRDAPRWGLPGRFIARPSDWAGRDEPGSGLRWVEIDRAFARSFPDAEPPKAGAEFLVVAADGMSEMNALLLAATPVARKGRTALVREESLGLNLCVLGYMRDITLVAWPVADTVGPMRDPLMTERAADMLDDDDLPGMMNTGAFRDGFEALLDLGITDSLPAPRLEPEYPYLVMASAHRRGLGIPDLLASLASVVEEGHADLAFPSDGEVTVTFELPVPANDPGHAIQPTVRLGPDQVAKRAAMVSHARSLGGRVDEMLVTMFRAVDGADWIDVDLDRDTRLLRDAYGGGCRLSDVALAYSYATQGIDP